MVFFSQLTKIKTIFELLWTLLILHSRTPDLIWRGATYFVQNNTTIFLPGDTRQTTSELQDAGDPFLAPKNLGEAKCFIFFSLVVNIYCRRQWETLLDCNALTFYIHWRLESKVFPDWSGAPAVWHAYARILFWLSNWLNSNTPIYSLRLEQTELFKNICYHL